MPPRAATITTPRTATSGPVRLALLDLERDLELADLRLDERLLDERLVLGLRLDERLLDERLVLGLRLDERLLDDLELEDLREPDFVILPPLCCLECRPGVQKARVGGRSSGADRWRIPIELCSRWRVGRRPSP